MVRSPGKLLLLTLTALAVALALAGCGDSAGTAPSAPSGPPASSPSPAPSSSSSPSPSSSPTGPATASPADTSLTVEFSADGDAVTDTYALECDGAAPVGSSAAPDPAAACAVLAERGADLFSPPDPTLACTQQIQGMQRAHVSGTVNGTAVEGDFSLRNGCEISRWESLTGLLGPAEGVL